MHATARETMRIYATKERPLGPENIDLIDALIYVSAYRGEHQCDFLVARHDFCLVIKASYEALGYEVRISKVREGYLVEIQWIHW